MLHNTVNDDDSEQSDVTTLCHLAVVAETVEIEYLKDSHKCH